MEHATLSKLIENSNVPIYVCDFKNDQVLYVNHEMERMTGKTIDELIGKTCYQCLMQRDKPCNFCHKNQLIEDSFSGYEAFRHFDGHYYRVLGKLAKWNGREAQVRYILEIGGGVQITSKNELQLKYEQQLELRKKYADNALAVAHYNLSKETILQVEYRDETIAKRSGMNRYEDVMKVLAENPYSAEEKKKLDSIFHSDSLIKLYFQGKTHITIKHRINGFFGLFEDTFDLFQNPTTFDIEAFATLRDITDGAVSDAIIRLITRGEFRSIMTIDANTGEAHPYRGKQVLEVIKEQKKLNDNIAGVQAYLRQHCKDSDIERVIRQTSITYVNEYLKTEPVLSVAFTIQENDKTLYLQAQYSYLDEDKTTILCVLQDISEAYRQLNTEGNRAEPQGK